MIHHESRQDAPRPIQTQPSIKEQILNIKEWKRYCEASAGVVEHLQEVFSCIDQENVELSEREGDLICELTKKCCGTLQGIKENMSNINKHCAVFKSKGNHALSALQKGDRSEKETLFPKLLAKMEEETGKCQKKAEDSVNKITTTLQFVENLRGKVGSGLRANQEFKKVIYKTEESLRLILLKWKLLREFFSDILTKLNVYLHCQIESVRDMASAITAECKLEGTSIDRFREMVEECISISDAFAEKTSYYEEFHRNSIEERMHEIESRASPMLPNTEAIETENIGASAIAVVSYIGHREKQ